MKSLVVCAACSRHVRRSETSCPFCGVAISDAVANAPERALPSTRLSRAALFAFATASVGAAGCSSNAGDDSGKQHQSVVDAAASGGSGGELGVPFYGAPSGGISGTGGYLNGGIGGASYGSPFHPLPPEDAGTRDATTTDASRTDGSTDSGRH